MGLMRMAARTAVVAGTATAVSGRVQRRQAEKFASRDANIYAEREQAYEQQVQPAPVAAAPAAGPSMLDIVLDRLRDALPKRPRSASAVLRLPVNFFRSAAR